MGERAEPPADPLAYASMVLYYADNSPASLELKDRLSRYSEVVAQDARAIPRDERPPWLRGTPTVVQLPDYVVHAGGAAVRFVEAWLRAQMDAPEEFPTAVRAGAPIPTSKDLPLTQHADPPSPPRRTLDELIQMRSRTERSQQRAA